jgi:hypothetical protein
VSYKELDAKEHNGCSGGMLEQKDARIARSWCKGMQSSWSKGAEAEAEVPRYQRY